MTNLKDLEKALQLSIGEYLESLIVNFNEITIIIKPINYHLAMQILCNHEATCFEQLIDLCGIDYLTYDNTQGVNSRFAVVLHLLSIKYNWRVRVRVFITDNNLPIITSITNIWGSANWYEREAFDLFGILFEGHHDLRRILTDYGFIGYPFRKDFPISGYTEMRYDEIQQRVIYQPVTIEPREVIPRVIRQDNYGIN